MPDSQIASWESKWESLEQQLGSGKLSLPAQEADDGR